MTDPTTSIVEQRFALEDARLIAEARRTFAAAQLAAAGGLAVAEMVEAPAVPVVSTATVL